MEFWKDWDDLSQQLIHTAVMRGRLCLQASPEPSPSPPAAQLDWPSPHVTWSVRRSVRCGAPGKVSPRNPRATLAPLSAAEDGRYKRKTSTVKLLIFPKIEWEREKKM